MMFAEQMSYFKPILKMTCSLIKLNPVCLCQTTVTKETKYQFMYSIQLAECLQITHHINNNGWQSFIGVGGELFFRYAMHLHYYTALPANITDCQCSMTMSIFQDKKHLRAKCSFYLARNCQFLLFPMEPFPSSFSPLVQNMQSSDFPPLPCSSPSLHSSPSFSAYLTTMATGDVEAFTRLCH